MSKLVDQSTADLRLCASRFDSNHAWWLGLLLAVVVVIAINPIGYIGGGMDDWQYLEAARCWRAHGPCLPHDHWQGRWPVIAPLAAVTTLFGESRFTVGLVPLAASVGCLVLLALLGNRLFGRPVGFIASLLYLTVPAFSIQLLDPTVEATELAFCLGGALALVKWQGSPRLLWPLLAGLSFSLAIQVRETAAVATLFAGAFMLFRRDKARLQQWVAATAGLFAPLILELIVFWIATGDPLWRRRLSLAHTQIPSSELLGPIDRHHSAFLNPAYIAHWRREPGIHIHWLVDGLVNLFANAKAGLLLSFVPVLLFAYRNFFDGQTKKVLWRAYLCSLLYISILIYVLAIDPKARMMFVPLAMLAVVMACLLTRLIDAGRRAVPAVLFASHVGVGIFVLFIQQHVYPLEKPAAAWIAQAPGQIEADENTRRHLALVPSVDQLPDLRGTKPFLMIKSSVNCSIWVEHAQKGQRLALVAHVPMSRGRFLDPRLTGELCLFKVPIGMTANELNSAVTRADWYTQEAVNVHQLTFR